MAADFEQVKQNIADTIYENGEELITGQMMQDRLLEMVSVTEEAINDVTIDQTVNVTVNNTTGTPSGSASFQNNQFSFEFNGIKGETGNSGYTGAAGELEVVNNLNSDDATAALSAYQGKVLDGKVTQLGQKVVDIEGEQTFEKDDTIDIKDDSERETYVSFGPFGVRAKGIGVRDKDGNYYEIPAPTIIKFDGIFIAMPSFFANPSWNLYFNILDGKFYKNNNGTSEEVPARRDVYYEDNAGRRYVYRDTLRLAEPLSYYSHFEDNEMPDLSSICEDFLIEDRWSIPSNIYSLFDALLGTSEKHDAVDLAGLTYPEYANGISADNVTYYVADNDTHETPSYKIYIYKIPKNTATMPSGRKIFLFSGEHGNERLAIYDLYVLAYNLINSTNGFYAYIRANFDVYIMPMLCVYSVYHALRPNANRVNINRNYPTQGWTETGAGTDDYTGPSAGSEFETQLVMALMQDIMPDIVIDHHNYSVANFQFYCESLNTDITNAMAKSAIGVASAFSKNYPEYFGTKNKIFSYSLTSYAYGGGTGHFQLWAETNGFPLSMIAETGECVNYIAGELSPNYNREHYTRVVFELAEYTLRSMLGNIMEVFTKSKINIH